MPEQFVRVEIATDRVATVTLDRPPVNAMNLQFREEFIGIMDLLGVDDAVGAIVLTGAGKVFSAGADILEKGHIDPADYPRANRLTRDVFLTLLESPKPVVAAVNGASIGAGFVIAACCDMILAAKDAFFAMPEIDVGQGGGASFLQRIMPLSKMRRMVLTGERVPTSELHRLGAVEECLPPARLLPRARELAAEIAAKEPGAVAAIRGSFQSVEQLPLYEGMRLEQRYTTLLATSEEARQARLAFSQKRKARTA